MVFPRNTLTISAGLLAIQCDCSKQCAFVLRQHVPDIVDRVKDAREILHDVGRKRSTARLFDTLVAMRASPTCLLYTSPSPRDRQKSRMPSSA